MSAIVNIATANGSNTAAATGKVTVNSQTPATTLNIIKTANTQMVFIGDYLTYTIQVQNTGTQTATNVSFTDNLPPEVQFSSASSTQGTVTNVGNNVTGNLGNIAAGATVTVTIVVLVIS